MKTNIFAKKIRLLGTLAVLIVILMAQTNLVTVRAQDSTVPVIYIISPESTTYSTGDVDLTFTLNEEVSWIGYSLDGADNQTITGNVTLSSLSEGSHDIVVYATDLFENTGVSNIVTFEISLSTSDTEPPVVVVSSPRNSTYSSRNLGLNFTVSEDVSWIGYSVDGASNITVTGNSTIWALSDGPHTLVIYATDASQNTGKSEIVYFTIDTRPPTIIVWPPGNTTYPTSEISLVFTLSEEVSWIGYSVDGASNQTITGNLTLPSLPDGSHNITVYATDNFNNTGRSRTIFFSIDTTLPVVSVLSPINSTYSTNSVNLNFTVGEEFSWVGYSLNGARNQTIDGDIELSSLSDGSHNIVVYATDVNKVNTGNSSKIFFTVDTTPPVVEIISPVPDTTYSVTNNITLSFTVNEEASLKYSLDGQSNITIVDSIILYNLTNGLHNLTIYAEDLYGNSGATETITFTVDVDRILQPVEIVTAVIIIGVGFLIVIIFGYKNKA
ncbi:MAG: Ig-like domain-containing protein [Candidatus Bathyarchaeota archaeon]|nr:Ig-like domain-containing protein [Candidatus Bathyarchaeum tardum]WGM90272.1 MAG: Ig-like domain-containing protein [Candidatus Bathyarchaeum tardum]